MRTVTLLPLDPFCFVVLQFFFLNKINNSGTELVLFFFSFGGNVIHLQSKILITFGLMFLAFSSYRILVCLRRPLIGIT